MGDMISSAVGGRVVTFNDEFFAEAANLLNPAPPVWDESRFTDRGKWMDGWETRRRREPGYDWCILALGTPGKVESVTVDTSFFTGNYAEEFSLEGCGAAADDDLGNAEWAELIPRTRLKGDSTADFVVDAVQRVTYLRLNIFPDGGVARFKVDGSPIPARDDVCPDDHGVDLLSQIVGGTARDASDAHYSPPSNMTRHTEPQGMWDGWETKRRRGPGFDWAIFDLGLPGSVESFVVDTRHFKGNAPGWVSILVDDGGGWSEIVTKAPIRPDFENRITPESKTSAKSVKLEIHPDGGVARFRVLGRAQRSAAGRKRLEYLNSLFDQQALVFFQTACAARTWAAAMNRSRPFTSLDVVYQTAETSFDKLTEDDWQEAFSGHPRIGQSGDSMANQEQESASGADSGTLLSLAEVNNQYEAKFGFRYIVYATGKTAAEMLDIATRRLANTRLEEVENASIQQRQITATRLHKMMCQSGQE